MKVPSGNLLYDYVLRQQADHDAFRYPKDVQSDALYKSEPAIRAALRLAVKAHEGQSRGKIFPSIPYIVHPIMVYDMLRQMGVTNVNLLAAAFLHDAREDCPLYMTDEQYSHEFGKAPPPKKSAEERGPLRLLADLKKALQEEGMPSHMVDRAAADICAYVEHVTTPFMRKESKGLTQIRHAESISIEARILKIADQTASIFDHLLMADIPSRGPHMAKAFAEKARGVVREIANSDATVTEQGTLRRWRRLFDRLYASNDRLIRGNDDNALRENFFAQARKELTIPNHVRTTKEKDWPEVYDDVPFINKRQPTAADTAKADESGSYPPECGGLVRVDFDEQGRLIGFMLWVAPNAEPKHYRNAMAQKFIERVEHEVVPLTIDHRQLWQVRLTDNTIVREGRYYRLNKPLEIFEDVDKFTTIAKACSCCDDGDIKLIHGLRHDLNVDYNFMRPPNAETSNGRA